jgi:hypothetical protein
MGRTPPPEKAEALPRAAIAQQRFATNAWRPFEKEIAGGLIGSDPLQAVLGNELGNSHQRLGLLVRSDQLVCEHGCGVGGGRVVLDIYRELPEGDGFDVTKLIAVMQVQLFSALKVGFLGRKAVAMNGSAGRATDSGNIGQTG